MVGPRGRLPVGEVVDRPDAARALVVAGVAHHRQRVAGGGEVDAAEPSFGTDTTYCRVSGIAVTVAPPTTSPRRRRAHRCPMKPSAVITRS